MYMATLSTCTYLKQRYKGTCKVRNRLQLPLRTDPFLNSRCSTSNSRQYTLRLLHDLFPLSLILGRLVDDLFPLSLILGRLASFSFQDVSLVPKLPQQVACLLQILLLLHSYLTLSSQIKLSIDKPATLITA